MRGDTPRVRGVHRFARMLNTMKDFMSDVGCGASDLAKRVGGSTKHVAKRVGRRTADLAEDIGPKRALIGLAILGAAVGGTILVVRYVRAKRAEQLVDIEPTSEGVMPQVRKHDKPSMHVNAR